MNYTTYDSVTGKILANVFGQDEYQLSNYKYIDGIWDGEKYYIDIDTAIPVEKPIKPALNFIWDPITKCWQANIDQDIADARDQRNRLLFQIDRVNPIWYASLTDQQREQLQQYRQDLLNVPQQAGFPTNIIWPSQPSWL